MVAQPLSNILSVADSYGRAKSCRPAGTSSASGSVASRSYCQAAPSFTKLELRETMLGGWLAPNTCSVTVAGAESRRPSFTTKLKLTTPWKPASGVNARLGAAPVSWPWVGVLVRR